MSVSEMDGNARRYTVTGLEEFSEYTFVISAVNSRGINNSTVVANSTLSAGMFVIIS